MRLHVTNHQLAVGSISLIGVSTSSMLQIGDTDQVVLYSMFDTPPESVVIGQLAPLPAPGLTGEEEA